jgi:hypothetical protein
MVAPVRQHLAVTGAQPDGGRGVDHLLRLGKLQDPLVVAVSVLGRRLHHFPEIVVFAQVLLEAPLVQLLPDPGRQNVIVAEQAEPVQHIIKAADAVSRCPVPHLAIEQPVSVCLSKERLDLIVCPSQQRGDRGGVP